jgi:hypothetical protein
MVSNSVSTNNVVKVFFYVFFCGFMQRFLWELQPGVDCSGRKEGRKEGGMAGIGSMPSDCFPEWLNDFLLLPAMHTYILTNFLTFPHLKM